MKKLAFVVSAFILCSMLSCSSNTNEASTNEKTTESPSEKTNDKAKKNLENTKAIIGMFVSGDFSKAGDYIAADGVEHTPPPPHTGEIKGLDSLKAMFAQMMSTMSDTKNEVVKGLSDDDYSMVWLKQSWTQKTDDPMMGMKAGQHGDMQTIEVCKHGADGKITDHWSFMSMGDMMKMKPKPSTKK